MTRLTLDIGDVLGRFPDFRVGVVRLDGGAIVAARPALVEAYVAQAETDCRRQFAGQELASIPGIAAWRRAYKGFGIKSTSYRSSVERLVKRVLAGDSLPRVNAFVDLYNAVSLKHVLCLGADDVDKLPGDALAFRYSRVGDHFIDMAPLEGMPADQPPKEGEVVYACGSHVLCRRWNWRQDARTVVGLTTRRVVLTVQSHGAGAVEDAVDDLVTLARTALDLHATAGIAGAGKPSLTLD